MSRREHYRDFHAGTSRPLVVLGNCQAESLRLLLDPAGTSSVRVPPVFELEADELPALHRVLAGAAVMVTQPVRDDYRGLALGTAQLRQRLPAGARTVLVPPLRFGGLHPHHVLHHPPDGVPSPPLVPYHDLRVLRRCVSPAAPAPPAPSVTMVRAVADAALSELRRREAACDVRVSDVVATPHPDDWRTVNHPGNRVLLALAERVAAAAGLAPPRDPGRPLLSSVVAPLEAPVAAAWGFDGPLSKTWRIEGRPVDQDEVDRAHAEWYAAHPGVAAAVWRRFSTQAALLGLTPGTEGAA